MAQRKRNSGAIRDLELYLPSIGTAFATTSGTAIDITSIPSWVKKIVILFSGLSTNGTSSLIVQIGDSGGIETSNYLGGTHGVSTTADIAHSNYTSGFILNPITSAGTVLHGACTLTLIDSSTNTWIAEILGSASSGVRSVTGGGSKALSGTLDRVRITTAGGADTFDAGTGNYRIEY